LERHLAQSVDRANELRWLTLPRVSNVGAKRPDHVFQLFNSPRHPIILCVESKETAATVEPNIGPRLTSYIMALMLTPASIERVNDAVPWAHSIVNLDATRFRMASAVAFLSDTEDAIASARQRAAADLAMCFVFVNKGERCSLRLIPSTPIGREIANFIAALPLEGTSISVAID